MEVFFMTTKFDAKIFNEEAFGKYIKRIPDTIKTELLNSGAVAPNPEIETLFRGQTNSFYGVIPFFGKIGGDAVNYDGLTDIKAHETATFERGVVAYGRANAWKEKDFSFDASGVDFLDDVAKQIVKYWAEDDQKTILKVLEGIFGMTTPAQNKAFVTNHTHDISKDVASLGKMKEDSLNNAIQKACGSNKGAFSLVIMHSQVATNLENLNLMERLKYTDSRGIQRELQLGTWNGKLVLVDDGLPTKSASKIQAKETDPEIPAGTEYTTYVLGNGAIEFGALPVAKPVELARDPFKNGGETSLLSRVRNYIAPYGFSYTKASQASLSPTNDELANQANWTLVNNGTNYIDDKAIPIVKIVSRG